MQPSDLASVLSFFQLKCAYYQAHFHLTKHPRDQYLTDFYQEAFDALESFQVIRLPADNFKREEFLFLFRPGQLAQFYAWALTVAAITAIAELLICVSEIRNRHCWW